MFTEKAEISRRAEYIVLVLLRIATKRYANIPVVDVSHKLVLRYILGEEPDKKGNPMKLVCLLQKKI